MPDLYPVMTLSLIVTIDSKVVHEGENEFMIRGCLNQTQNTSSTINATHQICNELRHNSDLVVILTQIRCFLMQNFTFLFEFDHSERYVSRTCEK